MTQSQWSSMDRDAGYEASLREAAIARRERLNSAVEPQVPSRVRSIPCRVTYTPPAPPPLPMVRHDPPPPRRPRQYLFVSTDDVDPDIPSPILWKEIIWDVAEKYGFTFAEIIGDQRSRPLVIARHEACYRLKTETTMSLPAIGRRLGNRDHTTILHGVKRHMARMAEAADA